MSRWASASSTRPPLGKCSTIRRGSHTLHVRKAGDMAQRGSDGVRPARGLPVETHRSAHAAAFCAGGLLQALLLHLLLIAFFLTLAACCSASFFLPLFFSARQHRDRCRLHLGRHWHRRAGHWRRWRGHRRLRRHHLRCADLAHGRRHGALGHRVGRVHLR